MSKEKYYNEDAASFASVLDFLEESELAVTPKRFDVIRYLLKNADENGIVRTTYEKVSNEVGDVDWATVGHTFRLLMKAGLISMTKRSVRTPSPKTSKAERELYSLTEYEIDSEKLREILRRKDNGNG